MKKTIFLLFFLLPAFSFARSGLPICVFFGNCSEQTPDNETTEGITITNFQTKLKALKEGSLSKEEAKEFLKKNKESLEQCNNSEECLAVLDEIRSLIAPKNESAGTGQGSGQEGAEVAGTGQGSKQEGAGDGELNPEEALTQLHELESKKVNEQNCNEIDKKTEFLKKICMKKPSQTEKCRASEKEIAAELGSCVADLEEKFKLASTSIAEQMREAQNRCTQNHNNVKQQRSNIESETQQILAEIDRVDDQILQAQSDITIAEDNFKQRQLNKEQQYRRTKEAQETKIRNLKLKDRQLERDIIDNLSKMEEARIKMVTSIKDLETEKQNACSNRFEKYINASKACYDKSVEQTLAERKEFNTKIQSGNFQVASLSKLINFNENSIRKRFKNRLTQLHQQCYKQTVGENLPSSGKGLRVQVSCDLATLEKRKKMCEQSQNKGSLCPQGLVAMEAENAILKKMRSIEKVIVSSKRALKMSEQTIALKSESMRDQSAEIKEQIIAALKELPILDEEFDKEIQFEKNKVAHARKSSQNKLLSLEKEKVRLLAMDPKRHFKESIEEAQLSCCVPISTASEGVEVAEKEDDKAEAEESESVEVAEADESEGDAGEKKQAEERQLAQVSNTFVADPVQCNSLNSYLNDSYRWKFITTIRSTTNDNTSFSLPQVSRSSGIR